MEDHIKTAGDRRAVERGDTYNPELAAKIERFFKQYLTVSRGRSANKTLTLLPWQRDDIVYPLWGWRKWDGSFRYDTVLITTGKKQGKSLLLAFCALALMMLSEEASPHIVIGACTRKQASELFEDIHFAIRSNEELSEKLDVYTSTKTIKYEKNNGRISVISSDAPGAGGVDASCVILDEVALHSDGGKLYDMLRYSMAARQNPLMILLSNAGWDKTHFYYRLYQKAKNVQNSLDDDPGFLACVYEVPEEADWKDESLWPLANPSLGTVMRVEDMRSDCERAIKDPCEEMIFRRWRCNQWTQTEVRYVDVGLWDLCKGEFPDLSNLTCYVGCDLSATTDLTSVVAAYPHEGKVYVKAWNFVPKRVLDTIEGHNTERYKQFSFAGHLKLTPGNAVDYEDIRNCIRSIPGKIKHIAFDKYMALDTETILKKEGYDVLNFPQFATYFTQPLQKLNTWISDRKIVHDGNTCMRWCLSNLQVKADDKKRLSPIKPSNHLKIDCAVALAMSLVGCLTHDQGDGKPKPSVYDTRKVTMLG